MKNMNMHKTKTNNFFISQKKIHFIGIGGTGMGGLALVLLKLGHTITGSDLSKNSNTTKLINKGAIIYFQHSKKNIYNIDYIVKSSAIKETNQELIAAKKKNSYIPSSRNACIINAI